LVLPKLITVTDEWDTFNYVPTPSFGRQRDDVTTQSSVPTSELSCRRSVREHVEVTTQPFVPTSELSRRRFVQSTTRVGAHRTFNVTRTNSVFQIPQDERRTTFRSSFASEQYRKSSGTFESSSRTFLNTLGALKTFSEHSAHKQSGTLTCYVACNI